MYYGEWRTIRILKYLTGHFHPLIVLVMKIMPFSLCQSVLFENIQGKISKLRGAKKVNDWIQPLLTQLHFALSKKNMRSEVRGLQKKSQEDTSNSYLTLLGLGLIKINDVSTNFNNPRPSLILNN